MAAPTIPPTARAAVLYKLKEDYVIEDQHPVPRPEDLAPGECLIRLDYSGVCHSDLHIQRGEWAQDAVLPIIGGHEGVGHIVAIGKHSNPGPIKIGDRVGAKWVADVCHKCALFLFLHQSNLTYIY
jgi:propanol-preferring alcohol dehydrogenase